jgi:hypothetical protein
MSKTAVKSVLGAGAGVPSFLATAVSARTCAASCAPIILRVGAYLAYLVPVKIPLLSAWA